LGTVPLREEKKIRSGSEPGGVHATIFAWNRRGEKTGDQKTRKRGGRFGDAPGSTSLSHQKNQKKHKHQGGLGGGGEG